MSNRGDIPCQDLLTNIDEIYGSDIKLLNGEMYMPANTNAEGFPFLLQDEFIKGDLSIKDVFYRNVLIKYDLVADRIILHQNTIEGKPVTLLLNSAFVDSVYLGKLKFVNTKELIGKDTLKNFMEVIYDNGFKLVSTHEKSFIGTYNNLTPNGSFSDANTTYYILQNNQLSKISNKRDLFRYFESNKKEIKKFLRGNDIKFRKATNRELKQLMNFCNKLTEES
ncbi:MAG: hypothetical protein K9H13_04810 [Bacteroidales bacterium]|nr:hypothetical protein [Bacteroidales bacterium]MCF8343938.1 hypothetical protein [Bacteroidales bacterium]MCF8351955.1 hypothetical protein [Bacteroidales bacterium]MCF8401941.1 hypothetical protein [Bacteroidales bacterium]